MCIKYWISTLKCDEEMDVETFVNDAICLSCNLSSKNESDVINKQNNDIKDDLEN